MKRQDKIIGPRMSFVVGVREPIVINELSLQKTTNKRAERHYGNASVRWME